MGSATLDQLAHRGVRVLGIEQFTAGHSRGSSHGDSRIIREQYFEHPLYVPLVQRAYQLWRDLETFTGRRLMTITGGLMIGPQTGVVVTGTLRSAREHALPYELLSRADVRARFPAFQLDPDLVAVLDPNAGFLDADACNAAHLDAARAAGADVQFDERVSAWNPDGDGVRVTTTRGTYRAGRLLIAAGPWTTQIVLDLALPLTVERQAVFWLDPDRRDRSYDPTRFPIYAYEHIPGGLCYGFPRLARGAKAAVMHEGEMAAGPDEVRRDVDRREVESLRTALRRILPGLAKAEVREASSCLFTNTPDHDFLVDWHPRCPHVLVSSPCSGHGFKFASAIGEMQADLLLTGRTAVDYSPFRIGRFQAQRATGSPSIR